MAKYLPNIPIELQEYLVNYHLRNHVLNDPDSVVVYTSDNEEHFKLALFPNEEESHYPERVLQLIL